MGRSQKGNTRKSLEKNFNNNNKWGYEPFIICGEGLTMTIEAAIVISVISLAFGIYQTVSNLKRNERIDNRSEAGQLTTVIVKLESIGEGVSEIKSDMRSVKAEVQDLRDRVTRIETSENLIKERLDIIEERR